MVSGWDGLNELISINSDLFTRFGETIIFTESSKKLERAVEDSEVNRKLDAVIHEFLMAISPYLMVKASLKCMEWLVHRYDTFEFRMILISFTVHCFKVKYVLTYQSGLICKQVPYRAFQC